MTMPAQHAEYKRLPRTLWSQFASGPAAFLALVFMAGTGPATAQIVNYPCPGGLLANCAPYLSSSIDGYADVYDDGTELSKTELFEEFTSNSDLLASSRTADLNVGGPVLGLLASASVGASAQTGYGTNRARAISTGSGRGTYLRDVAEPTGPVEDYFVTAVANAYSEWQEVWTADSGGFFSTDFRVDGELDYLTTGSIEPNFNRQESGGSWEFEVVIFSLDELVPNGAFSNPRRSQWRVTGSEPGQYDQTLSIVDFQMQAGHRYLMRVELSVNGGEWVETDFFNTATIGDLVLEGGLTLTAASGTPYRIATVVPEPSTYGMMLSGLLAVGFLARRRASRAV